MKRMVRSTLFNFSSYEDGDSVEHLIQSLRDCLADAKGYNKIYIDDGFLKVSGERQETDDELEHRLRLEKAGKEYQDKELYKQYLKLKERFDP